jgi:hypothetical protein
MGFGMAGCLPLLSMWPTLDMQYMDVVALLSSSGNCLTRQEKRDDVVAHIASSGYCQANGECIEAALATNMGLLRSAHTLGRYCQAVIVGGTRQTTTCQLRLQMAMCGVTVMLSVELL